MLGAAFWFSELSLAEKVAKIWLACVSYDDSFSLPLTLPSQRHGQQQLNVSCITTELSISFQRVVLEMEKQWLSLDVCYGRLSLLGL
jgi:hypothetical protein